MTAGFDWAVAAVYAGLLAGIAGALSVLRPLRFLGIRTRRAGVAVLAAGVLLAAAGALAPAPLVTAPGEASRLDEFVPSFQFVERHATEVRATPEAVFRAIRNVTAREIRFFRLLTWIRSPRLSAAGRPNILSAPPDAPLLDVALASGFILLAEDPGREIVFGTVLGRRPPASLTPRAFAALTEEGFCRAAMNFRISPQVGGAVRLSTETRVAAADAPTRRMFAAYWRTIYPGSALIRRMWLEAIRRRAEDPRALCREELSAWTRPVDEALAAFESEKSAAAEPAVAALAQARIVREKLEATPLDPPCAFARNETLVFLNHVILGFQAYLGDGRRGAKARGALDAILRRARAHQGRAAEP